MTVRRAVAVLLIVLTFGVSFARAQQAPAEARLLVTVMDPSGAVLQNATVTLTGLEAATKKAAVAPVKSNEKGLAIFDKLVPGRYTVLGQFQGFENGLIPDARLRAGDNKHVLLLPLKRLEDSVVVSRDRQEAAADRAPLFGTALTREQIELLSDDPDEMKRQLMEKGGPDAVFKVDSFEGRDLPPKAQIKSVRISRDQFAAESHYAGGLFIEIVTQPGLGPLRAGTNFRFRDSSMDGENPFTTTSRIRRIETTASTSAARSCPRRRPSRSASSGSNSFVQPNIRAATSGRTFSDVVRFKTPSDSAFASGYLDWARRRTRQSGCRSAAIVTIRNQGVGAYDLRARTPPKTAVTTSCCRKSDRSGDVSS
jgi:hypothetical protein